MKVVAVAAKVVEMFEIGELTAEAFDSAMKENGWSYEMETNSLIHKTVKTYGNASLEEVDARVGYSSVCIETEMPYSEYKSSYSGCKTKKDSYNKTAKTITVYIPAM